jgi:threonylcarbamoyladenosine tRNA methylthiotransferase MtaB
VKYSVVTFGCRVNQADSLGVEEGLRLDGDVAADAGDADLVIVNTCAVTASAEQAARQTIRRIARTNPAAKILVTGCYATRCSDDVAELPSVLRVVANDNKPSIVEFVRGLRQQSDLSDASTAHRYGDGEGACGAAIEPGMAGRTAFTLRVQTGCGEQCSYCIIPTTRGRPRSVALAEVLVEVERVVAAGFREIVVTGVHLGSYGRDLEPRASLVSLLRALAEVGARHAAVLFRISSLEPMDCTAEIVDLVAGAGCFAPHFHLPLQHASDRMLEAMRRPYTFEYYRALVEGIRARIPDASIGSDVIVGFPGETDDDFARLTSYLESSPITHVHVFPYSDRPGTMATGMGGKIHGAIVRERGRVVREIGQRLADRFKDSQIGTVQRGLTIEDGSLVVTGNYLKLRIPPGRSRNEWIRLRVLSHHDGEMLSG